MLPIPAGVALAAAEQMVTLHDVLELNHVGVAIDQHHRHLQASQVASQVVRLAHERSHGVEQPGKLVRIGRDGRVRRVQWRVLHHVRHGGAHLRLLRQHFRIESILRERSGHQHEPAHQRRMLDGKPERGAAPEGVAHDVHLLVAERVQDHRQIIADVHQVDRPVAEGGAAVSLQVYTDHLMLGRQRTQVRAEHLDLTQSAMQQQERLALSINGVVVIDAIGGHMAGLRGRGQGAFHGRRVSGLCLGVGRRDGGRQRGNEASNCDTDLHQGLRDGFSITSNEHGRNRHA